MQLVQSVATFFATTKKKQSAKLFTTITLLLLALIVGIGYTSAQSLLDQTNALPLHTAWLVLAGAMIVFLAVLGLQINGRIGGSLIDDMKLMSLSRFQLVAWTVVIGSSILAFGLVRAFALGSGALEFTIHRELWMLLGISAGAAAGKELVNSVKKDKHVENADVLAVQTAETLTKQGTPTNHVEVEQHRVGSLYGNPSTDDASLVDMFQGTEVANTAQVDMAKVQMFFFTIAALVAYGAEVFTMLGKVTAASQLVELPKVGPGLLALLTVSHATYLGGKTIDHSSGAKSEVAQSKAAETKSLPVDDPLEQDA